MEEGTMTMAVAPRLVEERVNALEEECKRLRNQLQLTHAMLQVASEINSSLSFSEVVQRVLDKAQSFLRADKVALLLTEVGTDKLHTIGARGLSAGGMGNVRFRRGEGAGGWVAETGESAFIPDLSRLSREERSSVFPGEKPPERGWLICVPLRVDEEVIGVLSIEGSSAEDPLSEEAQLFAQTLAGYASFSLRNARLYEELNKRVEQVSTLCEIGVAISSVLNVDRVLSLVVDSAKRVLGAEICSLMMLDASERFLRIRVAKGLSEEVVRETVIPVGEGISGWVAQTGEPLLITDIESHPIFGRKSDSKYTTRSLLTVPLKVRGEVIGVLNVNNKTPRGVFTIEDQNLLTLFASQAAIAIENANLYEKVERLAVTDGLTGLYVHRYFQEALEKEVQRSRRFQHPLSLLILDIDHFKRINDTYGHQAGDTVLQRVAEVIRNQARQADLVARYGGEEFVIILVETTKTGALLAAERLRKVVEESRFRLKKGIVRLTVSLGVSSYPEDASSREALIERADAALLGAKRTGRNQVCYFDDAEQLQVFRP